MWQVPRCGVGCGGGCGARALLHGHLRKVQGDVIDLARPGQIRILRVLLWYGTYGNGRELLPGGSSTSPARQPSSL